jgi:hypothetical protein
MTKSGGNQRAEEWASDLTSSDTTLVVQDGEIRERESSSPSQTAAEEEQQLNWEWWKERRCRAEEADSPG